MAAGYGFGAIIRWSRAPADRLCLQIGLGAVALFPGLRGINRYGNPGPWSSARMPAVLSFLNPAKYPASLDFLLMTLGPTIALIPLLEGARGRRPGADRLRAGAALLLPAPYPVHPRRGARRLGASGLGAVSPWLFGNHPALIGPAPDGYTWSLPLLYLVWAIVVVDAVFPLPLVRRAEGKAEGSVAEFPVVSRESRVESRESGAGSRNGFCRPKRQDQ